MNVLNQILIPIVMNSGDSKPATPEDIRFLTTALIVLTCIWCISLIFQLSRRIYFRNGYYSISDSAVIFNGIMVSVYTIIIFFKIVLLLM